MNDLAAIQRTVVQLIALASGLANNKFITIAGGRLPQVRDTYCTIELQRDRIIGKPSPSYSESDTVNVLSETIRAAKEFTLSLNFYRDGAMQYANNLQGAAYRSTVQSLLYQSKIGWLSLSAINNLTGMFSGETEERAQANITLLADGETVELVNQALSVDVDVHGDHTPEIVTFYATDPQDAGEFIAFDNERQAQESFIQLGA